MIFLSFDFIKITTSFYMDSTESTLIYDVSEKKKIKKKNPGQLEIIQPLDSATFSKVSVLNLARKYYIL